MNDLMSHASCCFPPKLYQAAAANLIPSVAQPPPQDMVQRLTIKIGTGGGDSIKKPITNG